MSRLVALVDSLVAMPVGHASILVPDDEVDHLSTIYRHGSWYEQDLLEAIQALQHGGVFVDIGAGSGNHTLFFAVECAADRVIAVEPYPGNFLILEANIDHNELEGVAAAHNALIHPTWKWATLNPPSGKELPDTWCWSAQPVLTEHGDTPCVTLDSLLAGIDVDVIKIDVEEASPDALATGLATLERCHPLVAIEAEPAEQPAVAEVLEPLGYECLGEFCKTPTFLWRAA